MRLAAATACGSRRLVLEVDSVRDEDVVIGHVLLESHLRGVEEGHLHLHGLLGAGLVVGDGLRALALAPLGGLGLGHAALALTIDLVADDHEGEILGVAGAGLVQELVTPAVELLEGLLSRDIVYEDAGIGTTVESDAETLEALLSGSIPNLMANKQ